MSDAIKDVLCVVAVLGILAWALRQDLGHDAAGQSLINRWWLP